MTERADRWIRQVTIGRVALLALIAGTVSYLHMHMLVAQHGQPGWVAALTPLSVDGMIVAASTTLLADSRAGGNGGVMPWIVLVIGSVASLAANVAVAEPTVIGRPIAAWPSFALIGSYELLMRQVRCAAPGLRTSIAKSPRSAEHRNEPVAVSSSRIRSGSLGGAEVRRQAWDWALANKAADGALPSGKAIGEHYRRHERWGRLVKSAGTAGEFTSPGTADANGQSHLTHRD